MAEGSATPFPPSEAVASSAKLKMTEDYIAEILRDK
jgi:hypothetical protein